MTKYIIFLFVTMLASSTCKTMQEETYSNHALAHKNLFAIVLQAHQEGIKEIETNSDFHKQITPLFKFKNEDQYKKTIAFLSGLTPGGGQLDLPDHSLFCQAINTLEPCFFQGKPEADKLLINLQFYQASLELCLFLKECQNCTEKENSEIRPIEKPYKSTKTSVAKRLLKFIKVSSSIINFTTHQQKAPEALITLGKLIKKGILEVFGAHQKIADLLSIINMSLALVVQNQEVITQALGVLQSILTVVA